MSKDVTPLVNGGIYLLKARNLTYGVYHNTKFYGFRSKFGDVYIDSEWSFADYQTASGTAEAIKQIGKVDLPDVCFTGGDNQDKLWYVLEAIEEVADEMWKAWYEEYTKNSKYKIDRLQRETLQTADSIVESYYPMLAACSNDMEAEQAIEYISTRAREYLAQTYTT
jgi:hypothetical protein